MLTVTLRYLMWTLSDTCGRVAEFMVRVTNLSTKPTYAQIMTGKPSWAQRTVTITAPSRGCHLITNEIVRQMPELREFKVGMANVFLKHTSASITLNENVRYINTCVASFRGGFGRGGGSLAGSRRSPPS